MRLNDDYAIVPNHEMERLFAVEQVLLEPKKIFGPASIFFPGEQVRIADGPFSGLNAQIEKLDDEDRITILMSLLGRASRLHIPAEQLEKL
jgi:transcriptional antiterminator NusG